MEFGSSYACVLHGEMEKECIFRPHRAHLCSCLRGSTHKEGFRNALPISRSMRHKWRCQQSEHTPLRRPYPVLSGQSRNRSCGHNPLLPHLFKCTPKRLCLWSHGKRKGCGFAAEIARVIVAHIHLHQRVVQRTIALPPF